MADPTGRVSLFAIEAAATFLVLILAFAAPRVGGVWLRRAGSILNRIGRRQTAAVVLVGSAALLGRLAILPWDPIPQPFRPRRTIQLPIGRRYFRVREVDESHPGDVATFRELSYRSAGPPTCRCIFPRKGSCWLRGNGCSAIPGSAALVGGCGILCAAICWMLQGLAAARLGSLWRTPMRLADRPVQLLDRWL